MDAIKEQVRPGVIQALEHLYQTGAVPKAYFEDRFMQMPLEDLEPFTIYTRNAELRELAQQVRNAKFGPPAQPGQTDLSDFF